jgi:hypothetical protein
MPNGAEKVLHMKRLVFLHIPKTAGQTVHAELERVFGKQNVCPVRTHTQNPSTSFPDAERYALFSGHIDWHDIDTVPAPRVAFSVLRDPAERIASFYFYLRSKAKALSPEQQASPEHRGMMLAMNLSADDYFFNESLPERNFIDDHYDNFYTHYFAARRIRGRSHNRSLRPMQLLERAVVNARSVDLVCNMDQLHLIEKLVADQFGHTIKVTDKYVNRGPLEASKSRFEALLDTFQRKRSISRIRDFCHLDEAFMSELGLGVKKR